MNFLGFQFEFGLHNFLFIINFAGGFFGFTIGDIWNILCLIALLIFIFRKIKNHFYYYSFISMYGIYLIGGKFGLGKTRLMAMLAKHIKKLHPNTIIIGNNINAYTDIYFSSFSDFCDILDELQLIGEIQNFDKKDIKEIEKYFGKEYLKTPDDFLEFEKDFKKVGSKKNKFVILGDEFHQYLYSRFFQTNFSGEKGKKLLETMHQVRHHNTLMILATQELDTLDVSLRSLASYEIETKKWLFGLFYGFSNFIFLNTKTRDETAKNKEFRKVSTFVFNNFNFVYFNFIKNLNCKIKKLNIILEIVQKYLFKKINKYGYNFYKTFEFKEFKEVEKDLNFNTKFNVKITKNIYKKGTIIQKIIS